MDARLDVVGIPAEHSPPQRRGQSKQSLQASKPPILPDRPAALNAGTGRSTPSIGRDVRRFSHSGRTSALRSRTCAVQSS